MRLLTHNLLACHAKSCVSTSNNFPLSFKEVQLELIEADFNEPFLRGFLNKVDWNALVVASRQLGDASLPEKGPDPTDPMIDGETLKALHHVLLEIHVIEGQMVCPNCAHIFQIRNGIPNMVSASAKC
ncbi:Trm112p-domain-containing protein [Ceraceosorus guamensis]|uniref:Trm112p-domain-containing protein n=1 Tax=Ceraceosorus guamensis TaxID=1522189 RepID=A0A316VSZ0_9BASI|nr:Trm112p-domain-containing protein [Ceraceosorus guamensis]PWN40490.1 Trm112p-domain-containing protein [Ceraceosorus guamensis]